MTHLRVPLALSYLIAACSLLQAEEGGANLFHLSVPSELRFSCVDFSFGEEEEYFRTLNEGDPHEQLEAARLLWSNHSRKYAVAVLKFVAGPPPGGEGYRAFAVEVEAALKPHAILHELKHGHYRWGAWLAFLRPHREFVPLLIANLKEKPEDLPETMLALGQSGDPAARQPLLQLLKSPEYRIAGDAAQALGYLGGPDVEAALIDALAAGNGWRTVQSCAALAKLGTPQALPALEKLAKSDKYTGALAIKRMAQVAVDRIRKRAMREANGR
ncbi:MAG: HEAT repeat domain-containing protein [Planctomycetes bacterium]|nr:HEAT repeat domain-containing protein [Planctomycetota bacterium]